MCVCVCVCACVVCVRACMCVCVCLLGGGGGRVEGYEWPAKVLASRRIRGHGPPAKLI